VTDASSDELPRLRRQLRALSAVNRQLHAQLAMRAPAATAKPRRGGTADEWLVELTSRPRPTRTEVVITDKGAVWVREDDIRRHLKAGLLVPALEQHLGPQRSVSDAELESWTVGPPVEVLEAPTGPAFVVVGGQRLSLRGLPVPFPVDQDRAARVPEGPELRVLTTWQERSRSRTSASSGRGAVHDVGRLAKRAARKGARSVKRLAGPSAS